MDRILLSPLFLLFPGSVEKLILFAVAAEAVGIHFQEIWLSFLFNVFPRFLHSSIDGEDIVAVHQAMGHGVSFGPGMDGGSGDDSVRRSAHAIVVVLHIEKERKIPN